MYRVLAENHAVRDRRDQLRHPKYAAPQLLATAPKQLWSWDITKLLGATKWSYFYLYVIIDVYCESDALAKRLIAETCERQGIGSGKWNLRSKRDGRSRMLRSSLCGWLVVAIVSSTAFCAKPSSSLRNSDRSSLNHPDP